jgi:hypothetical protein
MKIMKFDKIANEIVTKEHTTKISQFSVSIERKQLKKIENKITVIACPKNVMLGGKHTS